MAMWVAFFPLLADDAYIPARYVRQLYAGHGLVFNAGERINALTSPLHTLVLAAIAPLTSDTVTAPMSGDPLFQATITVALPGSVDIETIRTELEALADRLMVDIELED